MADRHALTGHEEDDDASDVGRVDALRNTADNNLVIMLNGEMVFGKMDGARPRPTPHVLSGSIVPRRPMAFAPAIVSGAGMRKGAAASSPDGSEIFDQSSGDYPGEDLSYEHARPISPIGDESTGSMQQLAREIDLMEGSYFSTLDKQAYSRLPESASSILSARGVARMKDISSSDDEDDEMPEKYMLSKPYRANSLKEDWVKAWGEAWGLSVNKTEEQKRTKRLTALLDKRESKFWEGGNSVLVDKVGRNSPEMPKAVQGEGPSILRVMETSLAKAAADVGVSAPPQGPKSPWANRTMEWASSEGGPKTPLRQSSIDDSVASAERTVKMTNKSKWLFGDTELTEDEEDEKLGEENQDGEEPWARSAKKQHRSMESSRQTMPRIVLKADKIRKASAERKRQNPHAFCKHAISLRERAVESGDEQDDSRQDSISTYTPDLAKLRLAREKMRAGGLIDDDIDYRPLFRRADGRLVQKLCAVATSDKHAVAQPTLVDMGNSDRVGAWV